MSSLSFFPLIPAVTTASATPVYHGGMIPCLGDVEPVNTRWLIKGYFPMGAVSVVAGPGGVGKGVFMADVVAAVTTGRPTMLFPDAAVTQTPFRMSFFGGGTDMESFFRENGGAVLSTTFDKYCYVNVRHLPRFFDYSTELSYSKTERVTCIEDIQHPAIRNAMKMLDMDLFGALIVYSST